MDIKQILLEKSEEKYREFSQSLIPNINNVLGVRLPILRKIAKEIYTKTDWQEFLIQNDFDYMEEVIQKALVKADEAGVHGKNITPFLLASIKDITGGKAFEANVKLALNNARCAAKIAKALSDME